MVWIVIGAFLAFAALVTTFRLVTAAPLFTLGTAGVAFAILFYHDWNVHKWNEVLHEDYKATVAQCGNQEHWCKPNAMKKLDGELKKRWLLYFD